MENYKQKYLVVRLSDQARQIIDDAALKHGISGSKVVELAIWYFNRPDDLKKVLVGNIDADLCDWWDYRAGEKCAQN